MRVSRVKSRDAAQKSVLSSLRVRYEIYYDEHNNKYPIVTGSSVIDRWNALKTIYPDLPDSFCYEKTKDPRYQYDYRNSDDGLRYVSTILLFGPLKSNNPRLAYWCVDNTGVSKEIKSLPIDNQFSCP